MADRCQPEGLVPTRIGRHSEAIPGAGGAGAGAIGPGATGGDGGDGGDVATGTVAVEAGEFLFSEVTTRVEVLKKEVGPGS